MERQKPCKKQAETAAEAPSVLTYLARASSYRAGVGHSIPVTPQSIPGMRMFVSDGWWRHHHLDMYGWTQAQRRAQCLAYCGYTSGSVVQRVCILQAPTLGCGHFSRSLHDQELHRSNHSFSRHSRTHSAGCCTWNTYLKERNKNLVTEQVNSRMKNKT